MARRPVEAGVAERHVAWPGRRPLNQDEVDTRQSDGAVVARRVAQRDIAGLRQSACERTDV